jgi:hypothetical protein
LVQIVDGKAVKAIKLFLLAQNDTTAIFNHGDAWLSKLSRLGRRGLLPERVLFAVEGPARDDEKRFGAYQQVVAELRDYADLAPFDDAERVQQFARQ